MPIYEYRCAGCGAEFDRLVRGSTSVTCPRCSSQHLERKMSLTSRPARAGAEQPDLSKLGPPPGGGCCGGSCHNH